jgi:cytoskeleton protein RodZ
MEIGETLRETRMRRRIDMTEVEAATKIRAKYLRALENEEWDLLPGPTFVKTFLRTYAEYLDLDPRLLVEEYRQRYERPTSSDLTPFGPGMGAQRRGRGRQRPRRPILPFLLAGLAIAALLASLYVLGRLGEDDKTPPAQVATSTPTPTATATTTSSKKKKSKKKAPPPRVTLRLTATERVYVCVVDATGKQVVGGDFLEAGQSTKTFRSRSFRLNLGNSAIRLSVSGRRYTPADIGQPIGYELKPGKKPRRLGESVRTKLCAT